MNLRMQMGSSFWIIEFQSDIWRSSIQNKWLVFFSVAAILLLKMKQFCTTLLRNNMEFKFEFASAEEIFLKNVYALTRSFTAHLLLLTDPSICVSSPSQMPLGQCCWPTLSQSLPGLLLAASSQHARTNFACAPSTTWAGASSAKRLTGGYCCSGSTEY